MGTILIIIFRTFKVRTYRGQLDLVVGLHAITELEGGGVLATCALVDLDLGSFEEVILKH